MLCSTARAKQANLSGGMEVGARGSCEGTAYRSACREPADKRTNPVAGPWWEVLMRSLSLLRDSSMYEKCDNATRRARRRGDASFLVGVCRTQYEHGDAAPHARGKRIRERIDWVVAAGW